MKPAAFLLLAAGVGLGCGSDKAAKKLAKAAGVGVMVKVKLPLIRRERLNGRCRNGTGTFLIIRLLPLFEFPERVHYARLLFLTRD
jgi:hypothetical protein